MTSMLSTWARAAISGTTPPHGACSAAWLATTDDSTSTRPFACRRTTAAAVSSQLVSRPRMVCGALIRLPGLARSCSRPSSPPPAGRPPIVPTQPPARGPIRIGARGSKLSLVQAGQMQRRIAGLLGADPENPSEVERAAPLVVITTTGDRVQDRRLLEIGGKGLFTKEIEEALLDGRIDCAVHSMKDVPAALPPGLCIAAVPEREDPRDAFLSRGAATLDELPPGARLGTASL